MRAKSTAGWRMCETILPGSSCLGPEKTWHCARQKLTTGASLPQNGAMSRPIRPLLPVVLAASSLAFVGCGTIYSDMYSPRRSRFVPPPPPATPPLLETAPIPPGDTTPLSPMPSSAPMAVPPAPPPPLDIPPPIPGLDPIPNAPLPADPAAPAVPAPEMTAPGTPPLELNTPAIPDPAAPPPVAPAA